MATLFRARTRSTAAYLVPLVGTLAVVLLEVGPAPLPDSAMPLMLLLVVTVSGWWGGLGPALVAAACALLAEDYFDFAPYSLYIRTADEALDLLAFVPIAVLVGWLNGRLRAALRRAEAERATAQAAVRARDEALAVVSHDLRTPMTAIQASVAALQDAPDGLPEAQRRRLLANIGAEADRLSRFITEALALGRLDAGVAPRLAPNDLGEIVSAVLDRCEPLLERRPLTYQVADDLPPVRCDPALLEQALTNLLDNVAAHTPPGAPMALCARPDDGHLRFELSDAGPGIPTEARERVFSRFERLTHVGSGAGLGLALARAAVEAQGGQLWVEDSSLGGACFVLRLPLAHRPGR